MRGAVMVGSLLTAFWGAAAAAQGVEIPPAEYPALPRFAAIAEGFVPAGWRLEAEARGDLNGDGRADLALVLRETDPANIIRAPMCEERFDTNPRILAVALAAPGDGYRLEVENRELIPRRENACQLDWFPDPGMIEIAGATLTLFLERMMSAGGWSAGTTTYKLRWRDEALRLIGFDFSHVRRNTGELSTLSINYLTGRARIAVGRIDSDREQVRWVDLHHRRLPSIDEIGDGIMFDPEDLVSNLP